MIELIGILFVGICCVTLAKYLTIGLLIVCLYIKNRVHHMSEETWTIYFDSTSSHRLLLRGLVLYTISLGLMGIIMFFIFEAFESKDPLAYSMIFIVVSFMNMLLKYHKNKEEMIEKLKGLRR